MAKKKILLAEDDPLIGQAYEDILKMNGYDVQRVQTGQGALDFIAKKLPDLMIIDLRMPEKDGFQVLEEMKEKGWRGKVPVLVTSNLDREADIKRCKKLGAKEYLIKSNTSVEDLKRVLKKYI